MNVKQLIRDALDQLAVIQDIAERLYMIGKVVDIPTIRKKVDRAILNLLTVDVILLEGEDVKNT